MTNTAMKLSSLFLGLCCRLAGDVATTFQQKFGHSRVFSLYDVLWICSNMFANRSTSLIIVVNMVLSPVSWVVSCVVLRRLAIRESYYLLTMMTLTVTAAHYRSHSVVFMIVLLMSNFM